MLPKSVAWDDTGLTLLDQTRLPGEIVYLDCDSIESVFEAIAMLRVRGAPAIGIAAAYGLLVDLEEAIPLTGLEQRGAYLKSARPTAVNLAWAVDRMLLVARAISADGLVSRQRLLQEARLIHQQDADACRQIGEHGLELIKDKPNLLTHCNAGALAVSELGTALAPIYVAAEQGINIHVFVDETRPLLQGARLTAFELGQAGVRHTLICDNMSAYVMSLGKVDAVIVGADRVTRNGDVANKIGTLNLAILCHYYKIPFYVACPVSTIDMATEQGVEITIEERAADEVRSIQGQLVSPADVAVFNPAFDITPHHLVTALITEQGVVDQPCEESLTSLMNQVQTDG